MSYYFYKNVNISDLFASGSTSIGSSYENFPTFLTTTNLAAKIDTVIPYQISGTSITSGYSISGNSTTYNSNSSVSLPTWCNAIKTIITTPSGSSGANGNNGNSQNLNLAIGINANKSSPVPGFPPLGIPPIPGIPTGFNITYSNYQANGGSGGTGGSGGAGLSVQLQSPSPYIFNTGTSFSTNISSNEIQLNSTNENLFTVNSGSPGNSGNNGNDGVINSTGVTIGIPGFPIPGLPVEIFTSINPVPGNNGNNGNAGSSGTYTTNLSNNNYTITSNSITTTTNNCQVYFFTT
jgi:hypothetical protein